MKMRYCLLIGSVLGSLLAGTADVRADSGDLPQGAQKRVDDAYRRRNFTFSDFGRDYGEFKNYLNREYGFDYSFDVSYMPQRGAPNGRKTAYQTLISPSFTWTAFDNEYGTGTLNFAYTVARYGGSQAARIGGNIGAVTEINDYDDKSNAFNELYYSYQAGGSWKWLTVAAGQFPLPTLTAPLTIQTSR